MATPLCVVFDTNVALALEVFADPRLLGLRGRWDRGELQAIADDDTLAEYERVLRYPELRLDEAAAAAAGLHYRALCTIVPYDSAIQPALPKCRDPMTRSSCCSPSARTRTGC
ncbi:MAG: PIN domain-containing protein [Betaproteobacteria bacterium]|nr:PIN domain-containing protein [Betaproteobacteria bacterium]